MVHHKTTKAVIIRMSMNHDRTTKDALGFCGVEAQVVVQKGESGTSFFVRKQIVDEVTGVLCGGKVRASVRIPVGIEMFTGALASLCQVTVLVDVNGVDLVRFESL